MKISIKNILLLVFFGYSFFTGSAVQDLTHLAQSLKDLQVAKPQVSRETKKPSILAEFRAKAAGFKAALLSWFQTKEADVAALPKHEKGAHRLEL